MRQLHIDGEGVDASGGGGIDVKPPGDDAAVRLRAGGEFINETNNDRERLLPFGGYSESGPGVRYDSKWHLEAMTQTKAVIMNYGDY
jgi:acyl-CoA reductase-like NAD-dependent aldehyde dehydrogenase